MAFTSVARAATVTTLLLADANRLDAMISNSDAQILYVLIGGTGTVSATNYSFSIAAGANYVLPRTFAGEKLTGLWASTGTGAALITYK